MGRTKLRDDELRWIEETRHSDAIRAILLRDERGTQKEAAGKIHRLYVAKFAHALEGETDEEYALRKLDNKKAKKLMPETEEDRQERMKWAYSVCSAIDPFLQTSDCITAHPRPSEAQEP